ncbi:hypothetical protein EAO68_12170 [Streptomyces sp. wa22]|nr:hypothetical protein EAO68_12170 [Streptomyces sp. wa22]
MYVSPEADGWTLVIGPWCDPSDGERCDEVMRLCTELSARYGAAQAYYHGAQGDGSAWLVAEHGSVVRRYCETGMPEDSLLALEHPLVLERAQRELLGLPPAWDASTRNDEPEDDWKWRAVELAPEVAAPLGTSPLALTAETQVRGSGVVASTPHPMHPEGPSASDDVREM